MACRYEDRIGVILLDEWISGERMKSTYPLISFFSSPNLRQDLKSQLK